MKVRGVYDMNKARKKAVHKAFVTASKKQEKTGKDGSENSTVLAIKMQMKYPSTIQAYRHRQSLEHGPYVEIVNSP